MKQTLPLLFAAFLALLAGPALAQGADCNRPAKAAVLSVTLPAAPIAVVASRDGCSLFVSLPNEIAVLSRHGGEVSLVRRVPTKGRVSALAVNPAGTVLAAATSGGAALFDIGRLVSGAGDPVLADLDDKAAGINVLFSRDGALLFVSGALSKAIGVYDTAKLARRDPAAKLGDIPVGQWPSGLALSPDGRWLYATVQFVDGKPADCGPPDGQASWMAPGELAMIDTAKAAASPATAVAGRVTVGCNPVRVALSPGGEEAYVTTKGDEEVEVVRTGLMAKDAAHAVARKVKAGSAPFAIAAAGKTVVVGGADPSLVLLDAGAGPTGSLLLTGSPENLSLTADGQTLLAAASAPDSLQMIDLARLGQVRK